MFHATDHLPLPLGMALARDPALLAAYSALSPAQREMLRHLSPAAARQSLSARIARMEAIDPGDGLS